jgi:hypothetical protein
VDSIQGLTIDSLILTDISENRKIVNKGSLYMALTRVPTLHSLYVDFDITCSFLKKFLNPMNVLKEDQRIRDNANIMFNELTFKYT